VSIYNRRSLRNCERASNAETQLSPMATTKTEAAERSQRSRRRSASADRPLVARSSLFSPRLLCALRVGVLFLRARTISGESGARESMRGQSVDSTMVVSQIPQPKKQRHAEFKGLTSHASGKHRTTSSGFVGRLRRGGIYLLIPQRLLAEFLSRAKEGLLNLKDLLAVLPPRCKATLSGFFRRPKRGETDMLIPQGLLAKFLRGTGEGLLGLKDLLTAFPPRPKGLFESEPVLGPPYLCRIAPKSAIFQQKRADNRRKWGSFSTDLERVRARGSCRAMAVLARPEVGS